MIGTLFSFFLALFILVVVHELGHFSVARMFGVRVLRFSFGFGKVLFRFKDKNQTEYTWSLIPLGGYVKMLDEQTMDVPKEALANAFNRKPVWVRFLIVLAGPLSNFILAWLLLTCVLMIGFKIPVIAPVIENVMPDTPAYRAGLLSGDVVEQIDTRPVVRGTEIASYVQSHPDKTIQLTLLRAGQRQLISVQLAHEENAGVREGRLGVQLKTYFSEGEVQREPLFRAAFLAAKRTGLLIKNAFSFVGQLTQGQLAMTQVSGPVGIAKLAGESVAHGVTAYLLFIAVVSVSLGVLNLLPVPLLDGGYLAYYVIEFVMRRPLPQRIQTCAAYLGFGMIFFITVVAFKNDLARLGW